jgi:hypothetical protein
MGGITSLFDTLSVQYLQEADIRAQSLTYFAKKQAIRGGCANYLQQEAGSQGKAHKFCP